MADNYLRPLSQMPWEGLTDMMKKEYKPPEIFGFQSLPSGVHISLQDTRCRFSGVFGEPAVIAKKRHDAMDTIMYAVDTGLHQGIIHPDEHIARKVQERLEEAIMSALPKPQVKLENITKDKLYRVIAKIHGAPPKLIRLSERPGKTGKKNMRRLKKILMGGKGDA